jgi:WD40 repeat protein
MEGHSGGVHAVAVSPDGRFLYFGGYDETVKQWEASSGTVRAVAWRCRAGCV